ncbi:MAG: ankyrin repeat domain-containing protein [Candidatus Sericytochromatia bacterium]
MKKIFFILTIFLFSCSNNKIESLNPISKAIDNKDIFNILYYFPLFIDLSDQFGKTPIIQAIEKNDLNGVIKLVNLGADVNKADNMGNIPIIRAIILRKYEIALFLLKIKANINIYSKDGETPLIKAILSNNIILFEELLNYGAKVDLVDKNGNSALMRLVILENYTDIYPFRNQMTEILMRRNPNVNLKNKKGETPLTLAKLPSKIEVLEIITKIRKYDQKSKLWI